MQSTLVWNAALDALRDQFAGARTLKDLQDSTRLVRITNAGLIESHPHDVIITKESPNYQLTQD